MSSYHLVQLNIAKMKYPIDAAEMADFVDNLENINALADSSPGFVWRLQTEDGDATGIDFFWRRCSGQYDHLGRCRIAAPFRI